MSATTNPSPKESKSTIAWQQKLLPWMIAVPTILIGTFIALATMRINTFEQYVSQQRTSFVDASMPSPNTIVMETNNGDRMEYIRLYALLKMEEHSMDLRYSQAAVSVMSGIYTKYLGFFTGMIMSIVGAVFIISKLKEDSSEIESSVEAKMKFRIVSSSPGIIFGVLGTTLMIVTVLKRTEAKVQDMPLYLNQYNLPQSQSQEYKTIEPPKELTTEEVENDHP